MIEDNNFELRKENFMLKQKNQMLEQENEQLHKKIVELENDKEDLLENWYCDKVGGCKIADLEKQIEKMKCCGNCANEEGKYCKSAKPCKNKGQWKLKE